MNDIKSALATLKAQRHQLDTAINALEGITVPDAQKPGLTRKPSVRAAKASAPKESRGMRRAAREAKRITDIKPARAGFDPESIKRVITKEGMRSEDIQRALGGVEKPKRVAFGRVLKSLVKSGVLRVEGEKRAAQYSLAN